MASVKCIHGIFTNPTLLTSFQFVFLIGQHRKPRQLQLTGLRLQHHGPRLSNQIIRQWGPYQDMARTVWGCFWSDIRQHPHGQCSEPHHNRPVLLPCQAVHQPNFGSASVGCALHEHKGHVRSAQPTDALRMQRLVPVHKHNDIGHRASSSTREFHVGPFLLECLWGYGDTDYSSSFLLAGGHSSWCLGQWVGFLLIP